LFEKLNAKEKKKIFQSFIVKKTSTFFDEMIHIMFDEIIQIMSECVVHLYSNQNKMMPLIKRFIFVNFKP